MARILERHLARIFIYGMTYPELSSKHIETVCTAGVRETGEPVRLYPIAHRYLDGASEFHKYQWIEAEIEKNLQDTRPESYLIHSSTIRPLHRVTSATDGWAARSQILFKNKSWQFDSMTSVIEAHDRTQLSLAVVKPTEICDIEVAERPDDDEYSFFEKLEKLRLSREISEAQFTLFEKSVLPEIKDLHFPKLRFKIVWRCSDSACGGESHKLHRMQVLDWEAAEMQRKLGIEKTQERLLTITDHEMYDIRFFLGNLFLHPRRFMIGGLWYPQLAKSPDLFSAQYESELS